MDDLKRAVQSTEETAPPEHQEEFEKCYKKVHHAIRRSPMVKFMMEKIEGMGCELHPRVFKAVHCDGPILGGFQMDEDGKPYVVLCANHMVKQSHVDRTITHELIHAFDRCRAHMKPDNCLHLACSEVRAAALSGDCDFWVEINRRNFAVMKQHQVCVKRRARLSLEGLPHCREKAEDFVAAVFEHCYKDTEPFDRMP